MSAMANDGARRALPRQGLYDCIVPYSGGKDSVFQLWYVVKKLGLKPLVVRFDPVLPPLIEGNTSVFKQLGVDVPNFAELACSTRIDAGIAQATRRFLLALPHRHLRPHHADRDPLRDAAIVLG
jgi:hypothetical protein